MSTLALLYVYWCAVIATVLIAAVWGQWSERSAAAMLLAASALSYFLNGDRQVSFLSVHWWLFSVDVALFAGLLWLSLRTDQWWTYVACGAQLAGTLGHLVKLLGPMISAFAYGFLNTLWAYVVIAAIWSGVASCRRRAGKAAKPF